MSTELNTPNRKQLFMGFFLIGIQGFGGVLPWARRMLVDQRKWLDDKAFTEVLGLAQILPGGNIINVAVAVGARYHGAVGSLLALVGLLAAPIVIVLMLATLYEHFSQLSALQHLLRGISAAAAGLVLAMGIKLAQKLERRYWCGVLGLAALVSVGLVRLPLISVLLVLAPLGIAIAYRFPPTAPANEDTP